MKRKLIFLIAMIAMFIQGCASPSGKTAEAPTPEAAVPVTAPKKIQKTLVPGRLSDLVLLVLPSGWEENYDFEKADVENNFLQMKYQKKAFVDFYLFPTEKGKKGNYLVRVDWDCKNGACTQGVSAYKFVAQSTHQEVLFKTMLSAKAMKKIGKDVKKCMGEKFQFGSMWISSGCILGFDFSETSGPLLVFRSSIMSQGKFAGPAAASLQWNPKKALFE